MRYRIESNVTRQPASQWFTYDPVGLCASMNLAAYHAGRGSEWGTYNEDGERVD